LVNDLLEILGFDDSKPVPQVKLEKNVKSSQKSLITMPLEKLQEMINEKLNEAKHKYSAVMKYSVTTN